MIDAVEGKVTKGTIMILNNNNKKTAKSFKVSPPAI